MRKRRRTSMIICTCKGFDDKELTCDNEPGYEDKKKEYEDNDLGYKDMAHGIRG